MRYKRSVAPWCGVARKHDIFRARNVAALGIFAAVPRNLHHLLRSPQHLLSLVEHAPGLVVERANSPHERLLHLLRHPVQFYSQLLDLGLVSCVPRIALWSKMRILSFTNYIILTYYRVVNFLKIFLQIFKITRFSIYF